MAKPDQTHTPLSEQELATFAVGEQPEEDGQLACLECGLWYRGLGSHVANAHGIPADEYRARHELPRGRGLWAEDARRSAGERAARRAGRYPKAVKTRLRGTRSETERAVAAQQESWNRAGTRALRRENWDRMAAQKRRRTQDKYEGLARAAGYAGIDDLIDQVADQSATVLAEILDVSVSGAKWVRRLHAAGFNLEHHPPAPTSMSGQDLSRLKGGTQPVTETHVLCRECGQWLRGLGRHLTTKHGMGVGDYRRRFAIDACVPLVPSAVSQANHRARAGRQDRRAQEHGYDDVDDLISRTRDWPTRRVATMLGVVPETISVRRRRLSP